MKAAALPEVTLSSNTLPYSGCAGRNTLGTVRVLLAAFLLFASAPPLFADDRSEMQSQLEELAREISSLQSNLEKNRGSVSRERKSLKDLDLSIQNNARDLNDVRADLQAQQLEVTTLEAEQSAYLDQLADREDALSAKVLAAWRLGRDSRLKLILNQDDPARLGRLLAYYDYLGKAQGEEIRELREVLATLDTMRLNMDEELEVLAGVQTRYAEEQSQLATQREERETLLAQLETQLVSDAARLEELETNRRDLEQLLAKLGDALADIPADLGDRRHPSELKGQLPMPTAGRVQHAFGARREAELTWQGWLIAAQPGQQVQAVAYGRVAYADWLRGYGLLLILDHGDGFMTLYGHNESLVAEVGDWVEPGEIVSSVGQGTVRGRGLYFELRRDGKAVDPAAWIRR